MPSASCARQGPSAPTGCSSPGTGGQCLSRALCSSELHLGRKLCRYVQDGETYTFGSRSVMRMLQVDAEQANPGVKGPESPTRQFIQHAGLRHGTDSSERVAAQPV